MTPERLRELALKWKSGILTEDEKEEFLQWTTEFPDQDIIIPNEMASSEAELEQKMFTAIRDQTRPVPSIRTNRFAWIKYAAAVVIIFSVAAYFWNIKSKNDNLISYQKPASNDLLPGTEKATLVLSDGTKIILDSAVNGQLATQGNSKIIKTSTGQLSYESDGLPIPSNGGVDPGGINSPIDPSDPGAGVGRGEAIFNTMSTPRGGQYKLRLPDGTLVWLNASSSITYPVSFSNNERKVNITGEAYFEIAKDKSKPFRVVSETNTIEVLGTHFNINAYKDEESVKTTLLEGSIKVITAKNSRVIKPGQQVINKQNLFTVENNINTEEVMAWKNGFFQFEGAGLDVVMKQLSRWYDTEIIYEGKIPKKEFVGTISRKVNASKVLEMLEYAGVKFRIENRKIIVMSK